MSIILRRLLSTTSTSTPIPPSHQFNSRNDTPMRSIVTSEFSALLNHSGRRWEIASPVEAGVDLLFNNHK